MGKHKKDKDREKSKSVSHKSKKKLKKKKSKDSKDRDKEKKICKDEQKQINEPSGSADIPLSLMDRSQAMRPMTKEEWEKKQSVVKRVLDESTGRYRLIKGDGEVIEEIVSRERHMAINRQATKGDGEYFYNKSLNLNK